VRIISRRRLREFWSKPGRADAQAPLRMWYARTKAAEWNSPADAKRSFGAAVDFVNVRSGRKVAIFDIGGNNYRLIAAIHFDFHRLFVLRIFTHGDDDQVGWKDER
jgi:mRNA interferase HigB